MPPKIITRRMRKAAAAEKMPTEELAAEKKAAEKKVAEKKAAERKAVEKKVTEQLMRSSGLPRSAGLPPRLTDAAQKFANAIRAEFDPPSSIDSQSVDSRLLFLF